MSGAQTTYVTARLLTPDYLVQGQDNTVSCPLYYQGTLYGPDEGTVSIYDAAAVTVVDAAAVTVEDNVASYSVPAALLAGKPRGMGWRIEWNLTLTGTIYGPYAFRNNAGLVKSAFFPVITDPDLFRREPNLNPAGDAPITSLSNFQDFVDEAVVTVHGRLSARGTLWHLAMEPSALREPLLYLTLHLVFECLRTRLNETFAEKSKDYLAKFEKAWDSLAFEYDTSDSGQSDGRRKRSANPYIFMGGFD